MILFAADFLFLRKYPLGPSHVLPSRISLLNFLDPLKQAVRQNIKEFIDFEFVENHLRNNERVSEFSLRIWILRVEFRMVP